MKEQENWKKIIRKYDKPSLKKSSIQIANSVIPYLICWQIAYLAYDISAFLSIAVSLVSMFFFIRIFIIFHDCGHGSFFKSKKWRTFWGYFCGTIVFTPYWQWTKSHATHHKHSGDLDNRGVGDIQTLTIAEYKELSFVKKAWYRIQRNPILMLLGGPILLFMVGYRFTTKDDGKLERRSVYLTNLFIVLKAIVFSYMFSFEFYLVYELSSVFLGSLIGIYLFYVQHQFEDVYWQRGEKWDYATAALEGCSYFKLPKLLQWGSGNIGLHHIHHLSHRIPNYNLQKAFDENELFQNPPTLTLASSVKCLFLDLYDEENEKLITFREYKRDYRNDWTVSLSNP